jgi:hypothetical protein
MAKVAEQDLERGVTEAPEPSEIMQRVEAIEKRPAGL